MSLLKKKGGKNQSGASKTKTIAGRIFMIIVLVGMTALVAGHFTDFQKLAKAMSDVNWWWIAAGVLIHIAYFFGYALLYTFGFAVVGVESAALELLPVVFAGIFVNAVVPSGAGAAALFIDDAIQRGQSGSRTAIGVVLVLIIDLVTLIPFVFWGVAFLVRHHIFKTYDAIGVGVFVIYTVILVMLIVFSRWEPQWVKKILGWVRKLVSKVGGWFKHPDLLPKEWPEKIAGEFCEASMAIGRHPKMLTISILWSILVHGVNAFGLWVLVKAFGESIPAGGLVAAFGLGIVFFVIVAIPQGVAIVEAIMTLIFTSLGVDQSKAVAATLVFRSVNFWLPLVVGLLFLWKIRRFGQRSYQGNGRSEEQNDSAAEKSA
ncbi:MAG: lysylphosphatidylglycerol synthase transmembrane domain-containing protein [Thermoanaerobaculia bacterium]